MLLAPQDARGLTCCFQACLACLQQNRFCSTYAEKVCRPSMKVHLWKNWCIHLRHMFQDVFCLFCWGETMWKTWEQQGSNCFVGLRDDRKIQEGLVKDQERAEELWRGFLCRLKKIWWHFWTISVISRLSWPRWWHASGWRFPAQPRRVLPKKMMRLDSLLTQKDRSRWKNLVYHCRILEENSTLRLRYRRWERQSSFLRREDCSLIFVSRSCDACRWSVLKETGFKTLKNQ